MKIITTIELIAKEHMWQKDVKCGMKKHKTLWREWTCRDLECSQTYQLKIEYIIHHMESTTYSRQAEDEEKGI